MSVGVINPIERRSELRDHGGSQHGHEIAACRESLTPGGIGCCHALQHDMSACRQAGAFAESLIKLNRKAGVSASPIGRTPTSLRRAGRSGRERAGFDGRCQHDLQRNLTGALAQRGVGLHSFSDAGGVAQFAEQVPDHRLDLRQGGLSVAPCLHPIFQRFRVPDAHRVIA